MSLTIIMYHYVRDLERSRYPAINARKLEDFKAQLDHLSRHYEIVSAEQVMAAAGGHGDLPENACWLTFDDGYLDHYTNVFPLLHDRGWQGSFFVPAKTVLEHQVLDVNKIHFVLASADVNRVLGLLRDHVEEERRQGADLREWEEYWTSLARAVYWASKEVYFIKQMLQFALPDPIRTRIVDRLFAQLVSSDEEAFASELYVSLDQLKLMARSGMYLGSHGHGHYWLNSLPPADQAREVDLSLQFLRSLGMDESSWVMCYPYGGFDQTTVEIVRERGCAVGLTTRSGVADMAVDSPFELPRLDTNDIAPKLEWRSAVEA